MEDLDLSEIPGSSRLNAVEYERWIKEGTVVNVVKFDFAHWILEDGEVDLNLVTLMSAEAMRSLGELLIKGADEADQVVEQWGAVDWESLGEVDG